MNIEVRDEIIKSAEAKWKKWSEDNQPTLADTFREIYLNGYKAGAREATDELFQRADYCRPDLKGLEKDIDLVLHRIEIGVDY
jgi:uncharacterized protein YhfF